MRGILTEKQLEVLKCVSKGYDNKAIARILKNTEGRIKNIRRDMVLKTRSKNMYHLIYISTKEGLI